MVERLNRVAAPVVRQGPFAIGVLVVDRLLQRGRQVVWEHWFKRHPLFEELRPAPRLDIARTIYFLAEEAPYITGQNIAVDGGQSLL